MEQVRKQPDKARTPTQRRFRIVKLEERIAPKRGGNKTHTGTCTDSCGG